jgi:diguanylate cyclase (GGDEF)-like protein
MRHGTLWMPLEIARSHPTLARALLTQAIDLGRERQLCRDVAAQLRHSHARADRLLGLLWEAAPGEGPTRWYSQRYMLERLDEEVSRARRHQAPLSVVLGELHPGGNEALAPEQVSRLGDWVAREVGVHKRRCDVAGQYGLGGFMLLLPHASAEQAAGACRRLRQVLEHRSHEGFAPLHVRFGTASVPTDEASVPTLLRRAEERLQRAVEAGLSS